MYIKYYECQKNFNVLICFQTICMQQLMIYRDHAADYFIYKHLNVGCKTQFRKHLVHIAALIIIKIQELIIFRIVKIKASTATWIMS